MKRLILNTANSDLIVLLQVDNKTFCKREASIKKHNETILTLIDEALKGQNLTLKNIDEFGVVIGPGSFTGIRVGIATIKAFRDVFGAKTKGINNLNILFETAKNYADFYAIEASGNTYFVGEKVGEKLFVNNRNLSQEELVKRAKNQQIACFELSEKMKESGLNFVEIKFDENAIIKAFEASNDTSLLPVYYQLSQAENDKINRAEIKIREIQKCDINQILSIENANFELGQTGDKPLEKSQLDDIAKNNMPNFVAEIEGQIVGYIFCEKTDEINISRVAVDKNFQNHGIATKLVEYAENIAKDEQINLSLEVSENNLRAIRLYQKLGFKLRRVRKNYYADQSNCLEMTKEV